MLHQRRLALLAVALLALLVAVLPAGAKSNEAAKLAPSGAFWVGTNGPQGGDGIALATSPNGHIFV